MSEILPKTTMVLVCGGKGGVGKSTVAANVAAVLAGRGVRTGLLDADLHGPSLPVMFGLDERPAVRNGLIQPPTRHGISLMSTGLLAPPAQALAWKGPLLRGALKQMLRDVDWQDPDVLVIDTPPGTGDVHMALASLVDIRSAVVVTTPQDVALTDTRRCVSMLDQLGVPVQGVVENMAYFRCPDCDARHQLFPRPEGRDQLPRHELPMIAAIAASGDGGTPIALTDEGRSTGVTAVFEAVVEDLTTADAIRRAV
ncbi:hypothetical protein A6A06_16160 [Streptomyces sp. CB02923]|uniref:P-loop NTPase n=1 Tax=Streptomyces sp. CB02923 TaxID=1718985 RepID=UPI00093AC4EA|nr:P-loop NTPase [Streptomyces sp. CB02923]OKI02549.1 hypothetical protein A6A06_16160 [Streptomyces sp. CB02923]